MSTLWQPAVGSTWNYQLIQPPTIAQLNNAKDFAVWGIDLFDTPKASIDKLQTAGSHVICYFSAGTYEPNRPDSKNFTAADQGKTLPDWPGEKWLKISSENVHTIMKARLDIAKSKGCSGVDPDNVDGFDNDNGLGLTPADSVTYMKFLSTEAAQRGMSIGLKNAGDIVDDVVGQMQWSVNEQCSQYTECDTFQPFINAGKPVFNIEYPKGDTVNTKNVTASQFKKACKDPKAPNFSKIIKNINLDTWIQRC